ncbi:NUDIX hydrolase [Sulfurimonas sp. SAG-AH-194-I05]|nr:NUDIX hydrolase [Sulfurimonas sp. SAG-AH-194-I05]MDF1874293.1 NUDIX hydrolase [Sulfurimonas sp. SAG-AH-194-I05]
MVKIDSITELKNPKFIKPIQINYTLNDTPKIWEAVIAHDSVAILLWHEEKRAFILVKQFRAPVLNSNKVDGMMYELCAGIIDKDASNIQIAKEEIFEECGYDVPLERIQEVSTFYTSVGISGTQQTLYYAVCNDSMKINEGGGLIEEDIEVIYIPLEDAKAFMFDETYKKTSGLLMAFYWFFDNKGF